MILEFCLRLWGVKGDAGGLGLGLGLGFDVGGRRLR